MLVVSAGERTRRTFQKFLSPRLETVHSTSTCFSGKRRMSPTHYVRSCRPRRSARRRRPRAFAIRRSFRTALATRGAARPGCTLCPGHRRSRRKVRRTSGQWLDWLFRVPPPCVYTCAHAERGARRRRLQRTFSIVAGRRASRRGGRTRSGGHFRFFWFSPGGKWYIPQKVVCIPLLVSGGRAFGFPKSRIPVNVEHCMEGHLTTASATQLADIVR